MRRPVIPVVVLLAAALALTGCSAGAAGGSVADHGSVPLPAQPLDPDKLPGVDTGSADGAGGDGTATGTTAKPGADRSVVVTGELILSAGDPLDVARRAGDIVTAAGGRIDGRNEYAGADGGAGGAQLVLRIPAAKLDATLDALKKLGHPERLTTSAADVTVQTQDLDARITALTATIRRMLELEQKSTDTTDLIAIETAIGDRQAELEQLQAQQRGLADQVAMSTITLTLQPTGTTVAPARGTFLDGLASGWSSLVAAAGTVLIVIGYLLPWIALTVIEAAVVVLALVIARRRARRRSTTTGAATGA